MKKIIIDDGITLCPGCMKKIEVGTKCPYCGYDPQTAENAVHHLAPGTILDGKYYIGKVLGQGGFGITYLGYDLSLELKVAIKEYYPGGLASRITQYSQDVMMPTGEQYQFYLFGKEKFIDEAKSLARYQSLPGVVSVHSYLETNNTAYIIMEYIDGVTLREYTKRHGGRIPTKELLDRMRPILDALEEVHQGLDDNKGLIHRDISPENIMVDRKGNLKLLDFGAAREYMANETRSMSVILRRGFAPAEQYVSGGRQGPWTDIYALCATIYYCITGQVLPESVMRMGGEKYQLPSELGIHIPDQIEKALVKGLEIMWQNRYQSIEELRQDLYPENDKTVRKAPVKTEKPIKKENASLQKKSEPKPVQEKKEPVRKGKKAIIPVILCLMVLIAAGGFALSWFVVSPRMQQKETEMAEIPIVTETPEAAETPEVTEAPEETETPEMTEAPEVAETPEVTEAPEVAETPEVTEAPEETETPEMTEAPEVAETPEMTEAPEMVETSSDLNVQVGDHVMFGHYEQDGDTSNGSEDIEWWVLDIDKENDTALLLSEKILEYKPYNKEMAEVTWETCTLRKWANAEFYHEAFDSEEQNSIIKSHIVNEDNSKYGTGGGSNTNDYIFLLSEKELLKYFSSIKDRIAEATIHAGNKGIRSWWLRSPGSPSSSSSYAIYVTPYGEACPYGMITNDYGFRPALNIHLSALDSLERSEIEEATESGDSIEDIETKETVENIEITSETSSDLNVQVGDHVMFGHYEQDGDTSNGSEDIEWRVLDIDKENDTALLLSEKILEYKPYNKEMAEVTWETCTLRKWANAEFYHEAFDSEEQNSIIKSHIVNEDNSRYSTDGGSDTDDYIFLLSEKESLKYFSSIKDRIAEATIHAGNKGIRSWWLRSPGSPSSSSSYAIYVTPYGEACPYGMITNDYGFRPALNIHLSALDMLEKAQTIKTSENVSTFSEESLGSMKKLTLTKL